MGLVIDDLILKLLRVYLLVKERGEDDDRMRYRDPALV
jgi:hypothetical protein